MIAKFITVANIIREKDKIKNKKAYCLYRQVMSYAYLSFPGGAGHVWILSAQLLPSVVLNLTQH